MNIIVAVIDAHVIQSIILLAECNSGCVRLPIRQVWVGLKLLLRNNLLTNAIKMVIFRKWQYFIAIKFEKNRFPRFVLFLAIKHLAVNIYLNNL